jgi:hypothetical protein
VFLENLIEDFSGFIDWPDQRQYFSRQVWMLLASFGVALPKIKRSSAKRRWWMAGEFLEIFKPLMLPKASSLNSSLEITSEPKMKRKGERGSLCLRPLSGKNLPKGLPFRITEKEAEEMHNLIQIIQMG